jgi:hypothetical protein
MQIMPYKHNYIRIQWHHSRAGAQGRRLLCPPLHTIMMLPDLSTMFNSLRATGGRANGDGAKKTRARDRPKAVPAPEANAELQVNIDVR